MTSATQPSIDYSLLKGRTAVVTGGASGLGELTTIRFAENGAYVTVADLQDDLGQALVKRLTEKGYRVSYVHCDTTDWGSSAAAFKHAVEFSPSKTLDIAALFAGTDGLRKSLVDAVLQDTDEPSLDSVPTQPKHRAMDVNLTGVYNTSYLAMHYFRLPTQDKSTQQYKKSLILVSSMMGYVDGTYNTDYGISKYGVRGLFRSLRSQAYKLNMRVNNIAPGYVLTPLVKRVHGIERPEEVSKAAGRVLPWTPIEHVVAATCHCAVSEDIDGRTFTIMPSGFFDIDETVDAGWGGPNMVGMLERDGVLEALGQTLKR
ncbi:hypothetical protein LTR56_019119 [Elasticomyces elasticus]|nr:hypothetical protein LTR56_019119 [Elasticomyces elasticus]KAK3635471.1 hypothetical protein LTR22_019151 [Elasticomyces elasticus]KAK4911619.1 hypothetical protein LTR49_019869 [Elasticomyces elasticus]KAK5765644.1 hypothetical protein LTS12_004148 [Elasticomyces elasticus]